MDAARLFARVSVAGADQAKRDLQGVGREVDKTQGHLDKLSSRAGANLAKGTKSILRGVTNLSLMAGTAAVGGLTYAAKKATDFEDAFAGVKKTVEGTPAVLAELDQKLRSLSTRIPVNYQDLAGIAQEAGALDVPTDKVATFTDVVARLSAATSGLTTEAAAEAFGKFGTIFPEQLKQTSDGYERMGSALIELGRNAASSESDIIAVTTRFAAAGSKAGLSVPQILGMASAISSLGVEPEAAGGAMSRIFNKITTLIGTGDAKVKAFAKATGMSVKEFSDYYARDAAGAVGLFLKSLQGLDKFQTAAILKQGGLTNVRDVNVIQLLSKAYEEMGRQTNIATAAFEKNTALQEVSAERFDTLKNKVLTFRNLIELTAATIGEGFTPALGRLLDKATVLITEHMPELKQLGVDIGNAIDNIDWAEVERGAMAVKDVASSIFDVIKLIPPQIDAIVVGLLAVNKLTFGAIGDVAGGALDVGKGVIGLGGRIGSMLPGRAGRIAGTVGSLAATPVFVTNWPAGGIGGAGDALLAGEAAAAAGGVTLAGALAGLTSILAPLAVGLVAFKVSSDITAQGAGLSSQTAAFTKSASDYQLAKSIEGLRGTIDSMGEGIGSNFGNQKNIVVEQLNALITEQNRRYIASRMQGPDPNAGQPEPTRTQGWQGNDPTAQRLTTAGALERHRLFTTLQEAVGPGAVMRAGRDLVHQFATLDRGGAAGTRRVIAELARQRAQTTDPRLTAVLDKWIDRLEAKLPDRSWATATLRQAKLIADGQGDDPRRISALRGLQQDAASRGNDRLARRIGRMIADERKEAHQATKAAEAAAKRAAAAAHSVEKWKPAVYVYPAPVTLNIDGRTFGSGYLRQTGQFTRTGTGPTQRAT